MINLGLAFQTWPLVANLNCPGSETLVKAQAECVLSTLNVFFTFIRIGLFLAKVCNPSQWPRFFSSDRSEKFAGTLSDCRSTCKRNRNLLTIKKERRGGKNTLSNRITCILHWMSEMKSFICQWLLKYPHVTNESQ